MYSTLRTYNNDFNIISSNTKFINPFQQDYKPSTDKNILYPAVESDPKLSAICLEKTDKTIPIVEKIPVGNCKMCTSH